MKKRWFTTIFVLAAVTMIMFGGCKSTKPQYDRPLSPGASALRKITDPAEMPDFGMGCQDLTNLRQAISNSLNFLSKPSSRWFYPRNSITHARAVAGLEGFAKLLDAGLVGNALDRAIRDQFDVYTSVGCDDKGTVLFTGYYTPIFDGSPVRTARFRYPLYKQPEDLIKTKTGEIQGLRLPNGQIKKYPSRRQIETSGMLAGNELVWLADAFEVYVAHVQGSAKIKMPDGKQITVGYTASNGHEYHSVSEELVSDGKIPADKISLSAMIDYFKNYPKQISTYTQRNPRFVFFQKQSGKPRGSINEPVIAMRSIATDKSIFPPGCLTYIDTQVPRLRGSATKMTTYRGFGADQDTGGAIRAAGRCDLYMGQGALAGKLAGQIYQEGRLYYLFLKN